MRNKTMKNTLMNAYTPLRTLFTVFFCLAFLTGCKGTAESPIKSDGQGATDDIKAYGDLTPAVKAVLNFIGDHPYGAAAYQQTPFENGTLVLAAGLHDGENNYELFFVDAENNVDSYTSGSYCWLLNYTDFRNKRIFYGLAGRESQPATPPERQNVKEVSVEFENSKISTIPYQQDAVIAVKNPKYSLEKTYGEAAQGYIIICDEMEMPNSLNMVLEDGTTVSASDIILAVDPISQAFQYNTMRDVKSDVAVQDVSASPQTAAPAPTRFYNTPEGNDYYMRYGQYIYYIPVQSPSGSTLYRMHEDGTDSEALLPGEGVSRFFIVGGKLYVTGQTAAESSGREYILQRIEPEGSITELKRYADGFQRVMEDEIYFASYNPAEGMELAEEQGRQWIDISGGGQGVNAKGIRDDVYSIDGYLYYAYPIADVPGKRYHQVLVKTLPDGTSEEILDKGQLSGGLFKCGDYLVYGRGKNFPGQMWAYDTKNGIKKLLFDMADVKNASDILEMEGVKDGWVYFKYKYKDSDYMLYRINPDDPKSVEIVWDWYKTKGELWNVDLENGWIYYGAFVRLAEEEQYMNSNDYGYISRSHRCRLDGSDDIKFCDRTARDAVTIGDWIYFASADKELKSITLKRYNTITGVLEEIPNGYVRKVHMGIIK